MADVIHKDEDLPKLSEAEQLVMRESRIDALSPEEQVKLTQNNLTEYRWSLPNATLDFGKNSH